MAGTSEVKGAMVPSDLTSPRRSSSAFFHRRSRNHIIPKTRAVHILITAAASMPPLRHAVEAPPHRDTGELDLTRPESRAPRKIAMAHLTTPKLDTGKPSLASFQRWKRSLGSAENPGLQAAIGCKMGVRTASMASTSRRDCGADGRANSTASASNKCRTFNNVHVSAAPFNLLS